MKKSKRLPRGYSWREDKQLYMLRFVHEGKTYAVYGKTFAECEEKKSKKKEDLKNHMHIDNRRITLHSYYNDTWLEECRKSVKESTLYHYQKQWKIIDAHMGKMKITAIQKADVIRFQKEVADDKTVATANRCLSHLKQVLKSAVTDRIVAYNPADGVKFLKDNRPQAADTNHRALSEEETTLFMDYAKDTHYFHLYEFLLNSGVRIGEACALCWSDIDWQKKEIRIDKTVARVSNTEYTIQTPKTKKSTRTIPISDSLARILMEQKEQNRMLCYNPFEYHVFLTRKGQMTNYKNIDSAILSILEQINKNNTLEHFSVHAFRDTFATRCIEQGMKPQTLKVLLGHSTLQMTMDLYAHVMPNTKAEELNRIVI